MCELRETINLIDQSAKMVSDLIPENFPNKSAFFKINVPIEFFLTRFHRNSTEFIKKNCKSGIGTHYLLLKSQRC